MEKVKLIARLIEEGEKRNEDYIIRRNNEFQFPPDFLTYLFVHS